MGARRPKVSFSSCREREYWDGLDIVVGETHHIVNAMNSDAGPPLMSP